MTSPVDATASHMTKKSRWTTPELEALAHECKMAKGVGNKTLAARRYQERARQEGLPERTFDACLQQARRMFVANGDVAKHVKLSKDQLKMAKALAADGFSSVEISKRLKTEHGVDLKPITLRRKIQEESAIDCRRVKPKPWTTEEDDIVRKCEGRTSAECNIIFEELATVSDQPRSRNAFDTRLKTLKVKTDRHRGRPRISRSRTGSESIEPSSAKDEDHSLRHICPDGVEDDRMSLTLDKSTSASVRSIISQLTSRYDQTDAGLLYQLVNMMQTKVAEPAISGSIDALAENVECQPAAPTNKSKTGEENKSDMDDNEADNIDASLDVSPVDVRQHHVAFSEEGTRSNNSTYAQADLENMEIVTSATCDRLLHMNDSVTTHSTNSPMPVTPTTGSDAPRNILQSILNSSQELAHQNMRLFRCKKSDEERQLGYDEESATNRRFRRAVMDYKAANNERDDDLGCDLSCVEFAGVNREFRRYDGKKYEDHLIRTSIRFPDLGDYRKCVKRSPWREFLTVLNDRMGKQEASIPSISGFETRSQRRTLMFTCSVFFHDIDGVRAAFLQELWRGNDNDYQNYGDCRSGNCCLFYDFTANGFTGDRSCRHWLYYTSGRIYNDFVVNAGDYRLMIALYNHQEAVEIAKELHHQKGRNRESHQLRVLGCSSLHASMDTLCVNATHEQRILQYPFVVVVEVVTVNLRISRFTLGHITYGVNHDEVAAVVIAEQDKRVWLLVDASPEFGNWDCNVEWRAGPNILQQVRRFKLVDNAPDNSIWDDLAVRRVSQKPERMVFKTQHSRSEFIEHYTRLNYDQQLAVTRMITQSGITPIVGPFGCGKTFMIATAVLGLREYRPSDKILVYAETNDAVDENLRKSARMRSWKKYELLRVGRTSIAHDYPEFSLDAFLDLCFEKWKDKNPETRESYLDIERRKQERSTINKARVIFATSTMLGAELFRNLEFDVCINDEGGQSPDAGLIMALRKSTSRLILVGDPRQLPPYRTNTKQSSTGSRYVHTERPHNLSISLLETLYKSRLATTLHMQYRCPPQISEALQLFYAEQIASFKTNQRGLLSSWIIPWDKYKRKVDNSRVVITDVVGYERLDDRDSCMNESEVWCVIELLQHLEEHQITCNLENRRFLRLLVITPYQGQLHLLKSLMHQFERAWSNGILVEVITSDSCIGREADVVILSLVRSNNDGRLGFMKEDKKRALVMLSRATEYMFVFGNISLYAASPLWSRIFDEFQQWGSLQIQEERDQDMLKHAVYTFSSRY